VTGGPAAASVDILVQPFCLRFSLHEQELVYHVAAAPDAQLDGMDRLLGIEPGAKPLYQSNLGFIPVATVVLVRGERTVLVDPGNHHVVFYGSLQLALERLGLGFDDVDLVVGTHLHHDHVSNLLPLRGKDLVLGADEIEFARGLYGEEVDAKIAMMGSLEEVPAGGELKLMAGLTAVANPGHTPGHIALIVDTPDERVAIPGDTTMTRAEWEDRSFSHWYTEEQLEQLHASLDRLQAYEPTLVLPAHDRPFRPGS
jgi:N-acyl homoserine lactone hydrolase